MTQFHTEPETPSPATGEGFLYAALAFAAVFFLYIWMGSAVRRHSNFDTEAWELGRFFELWWLYATLPFCCAFAAVAAMRPGSLTRALGAAVAAMTVVFTCYVGYSFWTQW